MKAVVAVSALVCLFIMIVLFQTVPGFLVGLVGDWSAMVGFVIYSWSIIMMIIGNIGLWLMMSGFKEGRGR